MEKKFIKILCEAIKQRRILRFYYESTSGKKEWRKIIPYMVCLNNKGKLELVGVPEDELKRPVDDREAGHYLINKLDIQQFEILQETFDDPAVPRKIVVNTQVRPVCRFRYNDEDEKEVIKRWSKIV